MIAASYFFDSFLPKSVVPYLRFFVDMIAASYFFDSFLPNIHFKSYLLFWRWDCFLLLLWTFLEIVHVILDGLRHELVGIILPSDIFWLTEFKFWSNSICSDVNRFSFVPFGLRHTLMCQVVVIITNVCVCLCLLSVALLWCYFQVAVNFQVNLSSWFCSSSVCCTLTDQEILHQCRDGELTSKIGDPLVVVEGLCNSITLCPLAYH
jgi:hypothetical protein